MKRMTGTCLAGGLAVALLLAAPGASLWAHCGSCGVGGGKAHKHQKQAVKAEKSGPAASCLLKNCPMRVHGADVKVKNVSDGVVIRLTSKDKGTIKTIQANAANVSGKSCACCFGKK